MLTSTTRASLRARRLLALAALPLIASLALASPQRADDVFFDSSFDGGWVGTVSVGKGRVPFQLNLNVEGGDGVGFLIVGDPAEEVPAVLEVFATEFVKISATKLTLRYDDSAPLQRGAPTHRSRFGTGTIKLSYKSGDDSLSGKFSGGMKGKFTASRMDPERPLQRLWQATFRTGGEDVFAQLATTEDADGVIGGNATFNNDAATATGQRDGNAVALVFALDGQEITFDGKLKTRNNKLQGNLTSEGDTNRVTFVPADGDGKPMKFKNVTRLAAVDIVAGQEKTVRLTGKNVALGALAFSDAPAVRVTTVTHVNNKALEVTVLPSTSLAAGTAVGIRLFNGDGETVDKANSLLAVDDGGGDLVDFELQVQPIFDTNCALSGCHSTVGPKAGLVLTAGSSANNLLNVPSSQQPALRRVLVGNPDNSYMIRKIQGGPSITGARMPLNRAPLSQAQIDLLRLWISQGAPVSRTTPH